MDSSTVVLFLVLIAAAALMMASIQSRRGYVFTRGKSHATELQEIATQLHSWVDSGMQPISGVMAHGSEVELFEITGVSLYEYQSPGSEWVGGRSGFSFPIVGRVRGYVGGSRGHSVKRPEQITLIDIGKVLFSSSRVAFVGNKDTRSWELAKLLDVELGDNGMTMKLATTSAKKVSLLEKLTLEQLPIGMALTIANAWSNGGKDAAKESALNLAKQIEAAIVEQTAQQDAKKKPA